MKSHKSPRRLARAAPVATALLLSAAPAGATNGYFSNGYSIINDGLAGASIAYPTDTLIIASNPAGLIDIGNRADVGIEYFRPDRGAAIEGNAFGPDQSYSANGLSDFFIPSAGYSHLVTPDLAVGIAAYGNGGMNTHYEINPYTRFGAVGHAGVNLVQLFISPTLAYQIAPGHALGISANLAVQQFSARGVGAFGFFSQNPGSISNRSTDTSLGGGVRLGYLGHITSQLALGAFWQSKTYSQKFDKYAGLFAQQGGFDIPSTYGAGLAFTTTPDLTLAADVTRINYSDVPSVGNSLAQLFQGQPFGASNGPGFGWRDVTSLKFGANYRLSPAWQVRAGFGYNSQPIPDNQTFLNILAPGVVQYHYTIGASYTLQGGTEISAFGLYAPTTTINGHNSIPPGFPPGGFGGGEANIHLSEVAVGVSVGWKL